MLAIIFFSMSQAPNPEISNVASYPSVTALFFRIIITLIFVILVSYLILRLIKRQQNLQDNQKKWVNILDYQSLGTNRGLYLMELTGKHYIVAATEGEISILKEIDSDSEQWQEIQDSLQVSEDIITTGIARLFRRKNNPFGSKDNYNSQSEFQQQLAEQLKRNKNLSHSISKGRDKIE